jgi:hypothetical protein
MKTAVLFSSSILKSSFESNALLTNPAFLFSSLQLIKSKSDSLYFLNARF